VTKKREEKARAGVGARMHCKLISFSFDDGAAREATYVGFGLSEAVRAFAGGARGKFCEWREM